MAKKASLILVLPLLIFISCSRFVSTEPIEKDCEYLKTLLPEASIDFSLAVDDGLDMDEFLNLVRKTYKIGSAHKFRHSKIDDNGINSVAFANAITWSIKNYLPRKDGHISVTTGDACFYPFCRQRFFISDVFFEKIGDEYFVTHSSEKGISEGMKYTGDKKNIVQTFSEGKIKYRYIFFSEFLPNDKVNINLNDKNIKISVRENELYPRKGKDIWYEEEDDVLTVVIKTFKPRLEKNIEDYEKTVEEICSFINNYSTVVFDFRDNNGGFNSYFRPILSTMIFGQLNPNNERFEEKNIRLDERNLLLGDYLSAGEKELLTKTVSSRAIADGNMMSNHYLEHKDKRYFVSKEPVEKLDFSSRAFKGKIFVITNSYTVSAAESALAAMKYYFPDNVIQLGSKTAGMLDFGGAFVYILPDSKVRLNLCYVDNTGNPILAPENGWRGDTEGFYPDFWFFADTENDIKKFIKEMK